MVIEQERMSDIRKPAVAGYFYPSDPVKLNDELETLLAISKPRESVEDVIGLISPHAGYIYSGRTAAYAYNLIKKKNVKTVIIISPSHREYFPGISIYKGDAYSTPLGVIRINKKMAAKLISGSKNIFIGTQGHKDEHGIEVQIPFLQKVISDFEIVPIVMGDQSSFNIEELASKLADAADDNTVIIASSDLSHFHTKDEADALDSIVERRISEFDYETLQSDLEVQRCEACGGGPIVAMMKAADLINKRHSLVLHRSDSSNSSGDTSEVVGYLSAVVYGG